MLPLLIIADAVSKTVSMKCIGTSREFNFEELSAVGAKIPKEKQTYAKNGIVKYLSMS